MRYTHYSHWLVDFKYYQNRHVYLLSLQQKLDDSSHRFLLIKKKLKAKRTILLNGKLEIINLEQNKTKGE